MRVLVTGHDGYIGAVMVPFLQAAGHECVGLDTSFFEGCTFDKCVLRGVTFSGGAPAEDSFRSCELASVRVENGSSTID